MNRQEFLENALEWRGIEPGDACEDCTGAGWRSYPNTAHGRGVGGQQISAGICETCWGSGAKSRPGVNLRLLATIIDRPDVKARLECVKVYRGTFEAVTVEEPKL